ncbi:hypothetical protein LTR85_007719 [Meristemomyces frigidus]|nr:hypothetical protein LTR85_007719 [Meristemomyces frigidus]
MTNGVQQAVPIAPRSSLLLPATAQCAVCKTTDGLSRCASCKAVSYCCREHQKTDWQSHKSACNVVKKASSKLEFEDQRLRTHKGNMFTPPDPFHTSVGRFWEFPGASPYLHARLSLVKALLKQRTREAVETALYHSRDMLRLAHFDNVEVRRLMPAMYMRLGLDQECYDFVKWWHFAMQDCRNDFQPATPYLTMKGEDIYEPIFYAEREIVSPDVGHMFALTLLKVRVLVDLRTLQHSVQIAIDYEMGYTPATLDHFRGKLVSSVLLHDPNLYQRITDMDGLKVSIATLESQITELYTMIVKKHEHIFCKLLCPVDGKGKDWLTADPDDMHCEACGEVAKVLQENHASWAETPGALDVIETVALKDTASCSARVAQTTGH